MSLAFWAIFFLIWWAGRQTPDKPFGSSRFFSIPCPSEDTQTSTSPKTKQKKKQRGAHDARGKHQTKTAEHAARSPTAPSPPPSAASHERVLRIAAPYQYGRTPSVRLRLALAHNTAPYETGTHLIDMRNHAACVRCVPAAFHAATPC